jgi:tetratricopeptide (TPR) repeat protein
MGANPTWMASIASVAAALFLASPVSAADPAASSNPASSPPVSLRTALQAFDRGDMAAAETAVLATLNDRSFAASDEASRHLALALAAQVMLQTKNPVKAQQYAIQATQMPQQTLDDWRNRLQAAFGLQDLRDEAQCVTAIFRGWGADPSVLPAETIIAVANNTDVPELSDVRLEMLETLYQRRWHLTDGRSASGIWRELSRMLLDAKEPDRAGQVAVLIDDPDDIIAMRADTRFQAVLKLDYVQSNAQRAAQGRIKALQEEVRQHPQSLRAVEFLMIAMAKFRMDAEVLALAADVERRIQENGAGSAAYEDFARSYRWILDARARALSHMGRYDEAVAALRQATQLPDQGSSVDQSINLADLLCKLDRPDEALAALPPAAKIGAYGRMQVEWVRLSAAVERDNADGETRALTYLREHRTDSPRTLQRGLLTAGALDEAEQWLLQRLNNPTQRTSALMEMQRYFEPPRPPRAAQWHALSVALRERATIRAAVSKVGRIDSYTWRYDPYD